MICTFLFIRFVLNGANFPFFRIFFNKEFHSIEIAKLTTENLVKTPAWPA